MQTVPFLVFASSNTDMRMLFTVQNFTCEFINTVLFSLLFQLIRAVQPSYAFSGDIHEVSVHVS